jgi:hypothetical protein
MEASRSLRIPASNAGQTAESSPLNTARLLFTSRKRGQLPRRTLLGKADADVVVRAAVRGLGRCRGYADPGSVLAWTVRIWTGAVIVVVVEVGCVAGRNLGGSGGVSLV